MERPSRRSVTKGFPAFLVGVFVDRGHGISQ